MKARIAIFTPGGIGAGINGQGFPALMQIVSYLADLYEVEVFSHAFAVNKIKNIKIHNVPQWVSFSILRWAYLTILLFKNRFQKKYDLFFAFWGYPSGTLAVMFGKLFNTPSMVYLLGGESADIPSIKYGLMGNFFTRRAVKATCKNATTLLALSHFQLENLRKYGVNRKIEVILFGTDKNLFRKSDKEMGSCLKIIHVANITQVKDQATLIRAFCIVKSKIKAQLKIVGPDYMNGQIQKLAKELKVYDDIEFAGWKSYNKIAQLLHTADCFMLTSLSEAQNGSITEAMMCGLLPISTRVGIMADLGSEYGVVCEVGDYESLARELLAIHQNPHLWKQKTKKSHAWAEELDLSWTHQRIVEEIEKILNPRKEK